VSGISDPALWGLGFVAGLVTGVSPCILPVMPVIFVSWTSGPTNEAHSARLRRRRAVAVVAGLVIGFTAITLGGEALLSALALPQDLIEHVGLGLLALIGLGLVFPPLERLIERPYRRLTVKPPSGRMPGFVLGLVLGAVFFPCAGPVLTAITTAGERMHVGFPVVVLSLFFSAGAALPLMALALAGDAVVERNRRLKAGAARLRPLAGVVLILMSSAIFFNWFSGLQRDIPGYVSAIGGSCSDEITENGLAGSGAASCPVSFPGLHDYGAAPNFQGITAWLNTPGGAPVTLAQLRGHVVLVDFYTYSCINCQRELPHVEAWYARYHGDGFDVVAVEAPEFAFEHVVGNVASAAVALGMHMPIAVDDNLDTWTAYHNEYWPAEYLINQHGEIVHEAFGEEGYASTETLIRALLDSTDPSRPLPPRTDVANLTPTEAQSPETYLGFNYPQASDYLVNGALVPTQRVSYTLPATTSQYGYYLGGAWTSTAESLVAAAGSQIDLHFLARDLYLVLSGKGTVTVRFDGVTHAVAVAGYPTLYPLLSLPASTAGTVSLTFTAGLNAYDFTFG
jgi:cytochrome c biogenesis protein CcdA/thiol-disulfide isomerase/thioredoxin